MNEKVKNKIAVSDEDRPTIKKIHFVFPILALILGIALIFVMSQRIWTDLTAVHFVPKDEVASLNYSFKIVDKADNSKVIPNQAVTVATNRDIKHSQQVASNAVGLVIAGNYSVCTKDSIVYFIMTKGCAKKVSEVSASLTSAGQSDGGISSDTKQVTVKFGRSGFIEPQFKELFVQDAGEVKDGISGKFSLQTAVVYSDGSGGETAPDLTASVSKLYEVGSVDLLAQVVSKKQKQPVIGQTVEVRPFKLNYQGAHGWFQKKHASTFSSLTALNVASSSDAGGFVRAAHFSICMRSDLHYYLMDYGCRNMIDKLSVSLDQVDGKSAEPTDLSVPLNRLGKGYTQKEFSRIFVRKNGDLSKGVKGEWRSQKSILLYQDGSGGKSL